MKLAQSIGAVVAGWLVGVGLSLLTDQALRGAGLLPAAGEPVWNPWLNLLALAYRCGFTVAGCFLAGRLAPAHPMLHALLLGGMGGLFSLLGLLLVLQTGFGPAWYPAALAVATLPCAWVGGRLARAARPERSGAP